QYFSSHSFNDGGSAAPAVMPAPNRRWERRRAGGRARARAARSAYLNTAVTARLPVSVTVQVVVLPQVLAGAEAPVVAAVTAVTVQWSNFHPLAALAVRVTLVPAGYALAHVPGQEIPAGLLATVPCPWSETLSVNRVAPGVLVGG